MGLNKEALALAAKYNKQLGADLITVASDLIPGPKYTSGSLTLDVALGGGWPTNQWVEIYGQPSQGKSFVTFKTIAANQERDPNFTTLWIASEHYDMEQAAALGVDNSRVLVFSTQNMEQAYQAVIDYSRARAVDAVVIDSYPGLVAEEEENKDMDENTMAVGAKRTAQFFRKIGSAIHRDMSNPDERPILCLFINQLYTNIGGWSPRGTPMKTPGGERKDFAFYVRVQVKRDEYIEESLPGKALKVKVGQTIKVTTVKNKQAPPQQVAVVDLYFRDAPVSGFKRGEYDAVKEAVLLGLVYDLIVRKGAWFEFGDERWQGKESMFQSFREQPDLLEALDSAVRDVLRPGSLFAKDVEKAETVGVRKVKA